MARTRNPGHRLLRPCKKQYMTAAAYTMDGMATISTEPSYLTTGEVAGLLRISEQTVRAHASQLGAVRVGNQLRFPTPICAPTLDMEDGRARPRNERHR